MAFSKKINTNVLVAIGLGLSILIFAIDLLLPLGIAFGVCYVVVMLLFMWVSNKSLTITAAILGIVLIIAGFFLSPPVASFSEPYIAIANRLLSIAVVAACAFVIVKYKRIEQIVIQQHRELHKLTVSLKTTNSALEEHVKERTLILENALKKLENSEAELKKSLEHEKELNELKSRFISMASHEFRTPLATILSSLSLVSKYGEYNEKEKQNKHIIRIKSSVTHLTDLINDVLSMSKLEEGRIMVSIEPFRLYELVAGVIQEMRLITKVNQDISYSHAGQNEVVLDKKLLRQILINLLSNAIKFSNEGSTINIRTDVNKSDFTLIVSDSGIGISEDDQKHLFERFFRGNNVSTIQGTGLGLNILARHVELLNGKISFSSKLGEGTTFSIVFKMNSIKQVEKYQMC